MFVKLVTYNSQNYASTLGSGLLNTCTMIMFLRILCIVMATNYSVSEIVSRIDNNHEMIPNIMKNIDFQR